jgi:hypothetical protein
MCSALIGSRLKLNLYLMCGLTDFASFAMGRPGLDPICRRTIDGVGGCWRWSRTPRFYFPHQYSFAAIWRIRGSSVLFTRPKVAGALTVAPGLRNCVWLKKLNHSNRN